jgi:hypothetical protein
MLVRKNRRLFFAFVLTAIVISGQVLPNAVFSDSEVYKNIQSEKASTNEDDKAAQTFLTATAYEAVIPILKLHIAACFYLVQELVLLCEIEQNAEFSLPFCSNDFFITLFRHFVAPNAP